MAKDNLDDFVDKINRKIVDDLRNRFGQKVAEFFENPRNMGALEDFNGHAKVTGTNGDTMEMWLRIERDRICRAQFRTSGCGHAVVCGCMAADLAEGKNLEEAGWIQEKDVFQGLGGFLKESDPGISLALRCLRRAIDSYLKDGKDGE